MSGGDDEIRELPGTLSQIVQIEDAFRETAEEARHAALEHLAARTQNRCARQERLPEWHEVVLVPAGAVQRQQRREAWRRRGLEDMNVVK